MVLVVNDGAWSQWWLLEIMVMLGINGGAWNQW